MNEISEAEPKWPREIIICPTIESALRMSNRSWDQTFASGMTRAGHQLRH